VMKIFRCFCIVQSFYYPDQRSYNEQPTVEHTYPPTEPQRINLDSDKRSCKNDEPYCYKYFCCINAPHNGHRFATIFSVALNVFHVFDHFSNKRDNKCKTSIEKRITENFICVKIAVDFNQMIVFAPRHYQHYPCCKQ